MLLLIGKVVCIRMFNIHFCHVGVFQIRLSLLQNQIASRPPKLGLELDPGPSVVSSNMGLFSAAFVTRLKNRQIAWFAWRRRLRRRAKPSAPERMPSWRRDTRAGDSWGREGALPGFRPTKKNPSADCLMFSSAMGRWLLCQSSRLR